MEVTPEIYAWLTSLEIIDPFNTNKIETEFLIPEKTCKLMFCGIYFDLMLKNLQIYYNKFYNKNSNLIENLSLLKPIENENINEDVEENHENNKNFVPMEMVMEIRFKI